MIKKIIFVFAVYLLLGINTWAQTYPVLDTGDPSERVCNPKLYIEMGNGVILDNVTGLEWDRWGSSGKYNIYGALDYCSSLNLGGNSDWRLPTAEELATLVDAGHYDPAIDPIFFSFSDKYWSSTAVAQNVNKAYFIDFSSGMMNSDDTVTAFHVRAVRGVVVGPTGKRSLQAASVLDVSVMSAEQVCSSTADCDLNEECIADICVPSVGLACSSTADCDLNEECIVGICVPSVGQACSNDLDCDLGKECIEDLCVPIVDQVCLSDFDCNLGEECIAGMCIPVVEQLDSFTVNGDGTVTDNNTEFMWTECAYGQTWQNPGCSDAAQTLDFDSAVAYVQNLNDMNYSGYDDWRFPTINELQSLMDRKRTMPSTTFPGMESGFYWASTNSYENSQQAWDACFWFGNIHVGVDKAQAHQFTVRAVRGGTCRLVGDLCLDDADCAEGYVCLAGECLKDECELLVKHKPLRSEKLIKPKKVVLRITGTAGFDVFGSIDLGPLELVKVAYNAKKGKLKIKAIVPAGLEPGVIPISVDDCFGEVEIE